MSWLIPHVDAALTGRTDPFLALRRQMDQVFDDFFPTAGRAIDTRLDVSETDREIQVCAELPGVSESDIELTLDGDLLTLKGEKKFADERKDADHHVVERSYGRFARSIRLPFTAEENAVSAEFKDGVLTVHVAKPAEAAPAAKRIPIQNTQ